MKDYYHILGVPRDFTRKQIQRVYHSLAIRYHPDKWLSEDFSVETRKHAEESFKDVAEAWSVLGDKKKKTLYDAGAYNPEYDQEIDLSVSESDVLQLFMEHISKELAEEDNISEICSDILLQIRIAETEFLYKLGELEDKENLLSKLLKKRIPCKKKATDHNLMKMAIMSSIQQCQLEIINIQEEIDHGKRLRGIVKDFVSHDIKSDGLNPSRNLLKNIPQAGYSTLCEPMVLAPSTHLDIPSNKL